jgi:hypothetical protein
MPRFDITFVPQEQGRSYSVPVRDPQNHQTLIRTALGKDAEGAREAAWNTMPPHLARKWYPLESKLSAIQLTQPAEAGDPVTVWKNQGNREATVIAVLGDRCLVEYTMPSESTALYFALITEPSVSLTTVAYHNLTKAWRKAVAEQCADWEGRPQQSPYDFVLCLDDGRIVGVQTGEKYNRRGYIHGHSGLSWTQLATPVLS